MAFSITLRNGRHLHYDRPVVMGIINVTPDSFYAGSRVQEEDSLRARVINMVRAGAGMIDVGAYSTRPDAAEVPASEELERLRRALPIIKDCVDVPISVDTFRADVAEACITQFGADVINDVSGGTLDADMLPVVVRTGAPYIMMHMRGTPQTMQTLTDYPDGVYAEVSRFFRQQLETLQRLSADNDLRMPSVILDPGFGFAKTLAQNYELMHDLFRFKNDFPDHPLFVGISRKSMIYRLLGTDADNALNGTTVLNTFALMNGADILRVHDVREAIEATQIVAKINNPEP